MDEKLKFLRELDAGTITAELFAFLDSEDVDIEKMESTEDFIEQFVDFIKEDFSYA